MGALEGGWDDGLLLLLPCEELLKGGEALPV